MPRLCDHVKYSHRGSRVKYRGIASAGMGWDPDTRSDVPMLRCTQCGETVSFPAFFIKRDK